MDDVAMQATQTLAGVVLFLDHARSDAASWEETAAAGDVPVAGRSVATWGGVVARRGRPESVQGRLGGASSGHGSSSRRRPLAATFGRMAMATSSGRPGKMEARVRVSRRRGT
jgi:hypothetical protein